MLTPGLVLQNRYRVIKQLGQRGMGAVVYVDTLPASNSKLNPRAKRCV